MQSIVTSHFHPTASAVHQTIKKEVLHGLGMLVYEDLLPTTIFDSKGKGVKPRRDAVLSLTALLVRIETYLQSCSSMDDSAFKTIHGRVYQLIENQGGRQKEAMIITSDIWTSDDAPKCLHFSDWPFH